MCLHCRLVLQSLLLCPEPSGLPPELALAADVTASPSPGQTKRQTSGPSERDQEGRPEMKVSLSLPGLEAACADPSFRPA